MIDNDIFATIQEYILFGIGSGLSIGLVIWLVSWCMSQLFHFFKALSK